MFPRIGNVLRYFRQKIERIKDPEIALRTGQQILDGGFRETTKPVASSVKRSLRSTQSSGRRDPFLGMHFEVPKLSWIVKAKALFTVGKL